MCYAVGIIPDGNRRWAKKNNLALDVAYWITMQKIAESVDCLFDLGMLSVSIFLLSKDNLGRPNNDLLAVIGAEERFFRELLPDLKRKHNASVFHAGKQSLLPVNYNALLQRICDHQCDHLKTERSIFLCAAYDPIDELLDNYHLIATNPENVVSALWVPHMIDIIIRTGGDCRFSGFLPLQCKYAEFFFEDYLFPEITRQRIEDILIRFIKRERRLGRGG
jgi:undecaprenyl diphosphate synthase